MTLSKEERARLGVVVIGRDEGARLRLCLESVIGRLDHVVYVDSGSRDGSPNLARSLGAQVVELDASAPYTAARGRNTGLEQLVARAPELAAVQFVDGDCSIEAGWLEHGFRALTSRPELGTVCGHLRERYPKASVYHRLSDIEWDEPAGEIHACGGVAMVRVASLQEIGGYNPTILAGEEAEMYLRLRRLGLKIERLDAPMALHDIGITRFGEWWRRAKRAGHAYAEVSRLYREPPFLRWAAKVRSTWFWGALLPLAIVVAACVGFPLVAGFLALGYPVLFVRVYRGQLARRPERGLAALYALFIVIGKFAGALGQLAWVFGWLTGRRYTYRKGASPKGLEGVASTLFVLLAFGVVTSCEGGRRPPARGTTDAATLQTLPPQPAGATATPLPATSNAPPTGGGVAATDQAFVHPTLPCWANDAKAAGSAITVALDPSRTQGVAPLAVFFDASETKAEGSSRPFHELGYCWGFGDPSSGEFATTGQSKNQARGPVAAHVFEKPGSYTVSVQVRDAAGRAATRSVRVTVDDPDQVFAGKNSVCFSGASNFAGCPPGAAQVTASELSALKAHVQPNRRLLLRRGETFRADAALVINQQGPGILGAFGSGARPRILSQKSAISDGPVLDISHGRRPDFADWRLIDLEFFDPARGGPLAVAVNGRASNLLFLRLRASALSGGFASAVDIVDYWRNEGVANQDIIDGFFIQDSEFREIEGYFAYVAARRFALLGNAMSDPREARRGSMLRLHWLDRAVISSNDLGPGTGSDGHVLYIPGPEFTQYPGDRVSLGKGQYARRFLISDNVLRAGKFLNWIIYIGCQNTLSDERFQDLIIERNLTLPGGDPLQASVAMRGWVSNATVRDNLFIQRSAGQCVFLAPWKHRTLPSPIYLPSGVSLLHNTCIARGGPLVYMDKSETSGFKDVVAHNNLFIGPDTKLTEGGGALTSKDTGNLIVASPAAAGLVAKEPSDWRGMALTGSSRAVDAADPKLWSPWDFAGRSRQAGKAPDVGALEYEPAGKP